jgi:hypothetical protein
MSASLEVHFRKILDGLEDGSIVLTRMDTKTSAFGHREIALEFVEAVTPPPLALSTSANWPMQVAAASNLVWGSNTSNPTPEPGLKDGGVITEPIIGYRDFVLRTSIDGPILMSRNDHPWPYRKRQRALCAAQGTANVQPFSQHDAPDADCHCGIYAYARPDDPNLKSTNVVWGEVALWGEVLICEKGFRAEFGYPLTLFMKDNGRKTVRYLAEELEDLYGVPVFLVEERAGKTIGDLMQEVIDQMMREVPDEPA